MVTAVPVVILYSECDYGGMGSCCLPLFCETEDEEAGVGRTESEKSPQVSNSSIQERSRSGQEIHLYIR